MKRLAVYVLLAVLALPSVVLCDEEEDEATDGAAYDQGYTAATTQFGVGKTEEGVDLFTGKSTLTIPLATLKGTAGFEYTLNLSYNSGAASPHIDPGYFGMGWFFSTPYIERQDTEIKSHGRAFSETNFDDRFWLILPEGSFEIVRDSDYDYDSGNQVWRTVKESGFSIVSTGTIWEWESFTVTTKNGLTYKFEQKEKECSATRADSDPEPRIRLDNCYFIDAPRIWRISEISDIYNNCISFNYDSTYKIHSIYSRDNDNPPGKYYFCHSSNPLEEIVLTQGSNIEQVITIETERRYDLEWEDDGGYFNWGPEEETDFENYPQRIKAVQVYVPNDDMKLAYAFKFLYDRVVGFGHPDTPGLREENWVQMPRQVLTEIKQYGSDYDDEAEPFASTKFEYDAFDWDNYNLYDYYDEVSGDYIPCHEDWDSDKIIGVVHDDVPDCVDRGFSYGVTKVILPLNGEISFKYDRIMYPLEADYLEYGGYDYKYAVADEDDKLEEFWTAVVDDREGPTGQYTYYYGDDEDHIVYNYTLVYFYNDSPQNCIINGQLGFSDVTETKDGFGYYYEGAEKESIFYVHGEIEDGFVDGQDELEFEKEVLIQNENPPPYTVFQAFYRCEQPLAGLEIETVTSSQNPDLTTQIAQSYKHDVNVQDPDDSTNCVDDRTFSYRVAETLQEVCDNTVNESVFYKKEYEYEDIFEGRNFENVTTIKDYVVDSIYYDASRTDYTYFHDDTPYFHSEWNQEIVYDGLESNLVEMRKTQRSWDAYENPPLMVAEDRHILDDESSVEATKYEYETSGWSPTYNLNLKGLYQDLYNIMRTETYDYFNDIEICSTVKERDEEEKPELITQKTYYDNMLTKEETDENGNTTAYLYDQYGRVIAIWRPGDDGFNGEESDPEDADIQIEYYDVDYELNPDELQQTLYRVIQPDESEQITIYSYDGYERLVRKQSPYPNEGYTIIEEFEYIGDKEIKHWGPLQVEGIYGLNLFPDISYPEVYYGDMDKETEYDYQLRPTRETGYGQEINYKYGVEEFEGLNREYKLVIYGDVESEETLVTSKFYLNHNGEEIAVIQADENGGDAVTYRYERDVLGNVIKIAEPSVNGYNAKIEMEYDGFGRMISKTISGISGNRTFEWVYEPRTGDMVYFRSPNLKDDGLWMKTDYDDLGRPTLVGLVDYSGDDPLDEAPLPYEVLYNYYYDDYGAYYTPGSTSPSGEPAFIPENTDNALGRLAVLDDLTDDVSVLDIFVYDTRGNLHRHRQEIGEDLIFDTDYWYNNIDQLLQIRYPSGNWVFLDYDELQRLLRIRGKIDEDEKTYVSEINYNSLGMMTEMDYANGCKTYYSYDGSQLAHLQADMTAIDPHYFKLDNLDDIEFMDEDHRWRLESNGFTGYSIAVNNVTETQSEDPPFTQDSDKMLEVEIAKTGVPGPSGPSYIAGPPVGESAHWWMFDKLEYDVRMEGSGDPDDIAGAWSFEIVPPDESEPVLIPLFYFESSPPVMQKNTWYHIEVPLLDEIIFPHVEDWSWGDIGRIRLKRTAEDLPDDGGQIVAEYIYLDNIDLTCDQTMFSLDYTYGDDNLIDTITDSPTCTSPNPDLEHCFLHTYTYDGRGQLEAHDFDEVYMSGMDQKQKPMETWGYTHSDRGNRTNLVYDSWKYDQDAQFATIERPEVLTYLDHTNRIATQNVDSGDPLISFTLDYNGNVVATTRLDATSTLVYDYTYDYTDRMRELSIHDTVMPVPNEFFLMECGYDAGGLRLRRKITDNVEETEEERRFIYDQNDLLIAEYVWDGDSWELSREYVNDANGVVCTIDYDYRDWGGYELGWHLKDHLGSTLAVVADPVLTVPPEVPLKPGQRILWTGNYESFGRPDNNVPVCPGAWDNPIQFTGYYSDGDVFEHYYARARYYDPYTGRFLSRDPVDFEYDKVPIAINRYPYAGNNPLRYVDPNGEFFFIPFLLAGVDILGWGIGAAVAADFLVAGGIEWLANPEGGFGEAMVAGFRQVFSDALMIGYASIFSAVYNTGATSIDFGSSLAAIEDSFTRGTRFLHVFNTYLTWGQQTVLNLSGAAYKWGGDWLPQGLHHGWAGYLGAYTGLVNLGGAYNIFELGFGIFMSYLSWDDFVQHLGQVWLNNPNYHTLVHYWEF